MSKDHDSQTVLITGATDGLGKAAALLLAERGYRVFAAGRSAEKRAQLDALAREKRLPLETVEMDVRDDEKDTSLRARGTAKWHEGYTYTAPANFHQGSWLQPSCMGAVPLGLETCTHAA